MNIVFLRWQVEIHGTEMNGWLKNELRKHYEPQILIPGLKFDRQYWIGAKVSVRMISYNKNF